MTSQLALRAPATEAPPPTTAASADDRATGGVGIVGLGYVGLPTALSLAEHGTHVVGVDASAARVAAVRAGDVDLLASDHDRLGRLLDTAALRVGTDPGLLAEVDTILICVPTPVDEHQVPDLGAVRSACAGVVEAMRPGQLVVLTSTSYVGTTRELLVGPLERRGFEVGRDVCVAFSPERIDPGNTTHPQETVPRVVGGVTPGCTARAAGVLRRTTPSVHEVSSPETAEMTKLLENTFRAVNIALANEMSDVARALELDILEVITAASTKPYGFMPFYPGPGVGGHCIPCDPHYLLWQLRAHRMAPALVGAAMDNIAARPHQVVERCRALLAEAGKGLAGARVLVVGVTYKPGVADLRESPALAIIAELAGQRVEVGYTDPHVSSLRGPDGGPLHSVADPAGEAWDLVLVHTAHPTADLDWLAGAPLVLDATYRLVGVPQRARL